MTEKEQPLTLGFVSRKLSGWLDKQTSANLPTGRQVAKPNFSSDKQL